MDLYFLLELIGTIAFAVSGAGIAIRKKMDILGIIFLGLLTAVGGGILRDLILGVTPPVAFQTPVYSFIAIVVSVLTFLFRSKSKLLLDYNLVLLAMDSIGLAEFTVAGVKAGMYSGNIFLEIVVGFLTGVGGGMLRDIFAGEIPAIFDKGFYASASIIGAAATVFLWPLGGNFAMFCGTILILLLRFAAIKFQWDLPKA